MAEPKNIKNEERYKIIEQQFLGGSNKPKTESGWKQPGDLKRAIGRLDSTDWNVKQIEEKLAKDSKKTESNREKVPKWSKEAFNDKLAKVKGNLYSVEDDKKQKEIDASLAKLQAKLRDGNVVDSDKGSNKVSHLVGELSNKFLPNDEKPELKREGSNVWVPPKPKAGKSDNCFFCNKKVYVVERMSAEGKFFHRACFRCDYCNILLRLGSYVYHREGRFAGKFFCIPHSTENALEKYRFRNKRDEIQANEDKKKELAKRREEKGPLSSLSPTNRSRLRDHDLLARGATPERAEYEASIDLSAEESGLEQIDEDEWTDRNFGNSNANDMNTSEDSVSDLESDAEEGEVGLEVERPLTADETRRLQREWRARYKGRSGLGSDGSDGDIDREVRYTDHEYEDDTSDGEDDQINTRVPFLPGSGGRQRQRRRSSDDSTSSDYTTSSIESSSDESGLRDLDEKFNRDNPFTVPKIVVQPNSPVPPTSVSKPSTKPIQPDPKYISQSVPLGPSAYGSALYQPSLSSMMKYQHKTPALPSQPPQQTNSQYRTLSGVLSNNLKKNWVTPSAPASQTQRKVDQAEIDARLKSLMDRLSSQQSLLKPPEKPSSQMQHFLDATKKPQERKLSDTRPFVPYKPSVRPVTSSPTKDDG